MANSPKISVVVPTFNEEKYIKNVFEGLSNQTFKDFETIVVDGNSTDATREIAKRHGARIIVEPIRGIGRARNKGAEAARGEMVVFLDGDTRPHPNLLQIYYDAFKTEEGIVAATGPILPLEKSKKRVSLGFKLVSEIFVQASILFGRPSVVGLNFAVKKDAFHRIGGFNTVFKTYEDWDLSLRLRKEGKIKYLNDAIVSTSIRRINAWGVHGFFLYHTSNMLRYHFLRKPKDYYEDIR